MAYRTRTYIAADWTSDKDAVDQLHKWNDDNNLSLSFTDAHDLSQARDESLNCNIKRSLGTRLDASKTFVLIVGKDTNSLRSGSCQYCNSYNSWTGSCARGNSVDLRSYVEYECSKAVRDELRIIVLYKFAAVNTSKCPDAVKDVGTHVAMLYLKDSKYYWDYQTVKNAITK
ncbi:MAG: TIR domain-containing protein [Flavobacteriales bacterium]|nr:TIR domain-containing protein [Flavobacteriales bacterium]